MSNKFQIPKFKPFARLPAGRDFVICYFLGRCPSPVPPFEKGGATLFPPFEKGGLGGIYTL
jgi:hypothetical protein